MQERSVSLLPTFWITSNDIPAPEDKLSFLKGVDKTLGPFLPQGN